MAGAAMAAANSPMATFYHALFHTALPGPTALLPDLQGVLAGSALSATIGHAILLWAATRCRTGKP